MKTAYKTTAQAFTSTKQTATGTVLFDEDTRRIIESRKNEKPIPSTLFWAQLSKELGMNL